MEIERDSVSDTSILDHERRTSWRLRGFSPLCVNICAKKMTWVEAFRKGPSRTTRILNLGSQHGHQHASHQGANGAGFDGACVISGIERFGPAGDRAISWRIHKVRHNTAVVFEAQPMPPRTVRFDVWCEVLEISRRFFALHRFLASSRGCRYPGPVSCVSSLALA